MFLFSNFVWVDVDVGVWPELPVKRVDVILGNDVAGARIWPDEQTRARNIASSENHQVFDALNQIVSSVCAVTRSMTASVSEVKSKLHKGNVRFALSLLLSVSHTELRQLFDCVVPMYEVEKKSPVYFRQDVLLMRRWVLLWGKCGLWVCVAGGFAHEV